MGAIRLAISLKPRAWDASPRFCPGFARAPEVGFNGAVLYRELLEQGLLGSSVIVRRAIWPWRMAAVPAATMRFESAPGEQAQVDCAQARVWIREAQVPACHRQCEIAQHRREALHTRVSGVRA